HLVHRLQREYPTQTIMPLAEVPPFCTSMGQITVHNLARLLEALARGEYRNEVTVEAETARWAKVALERMLAL
ncbi:MAG: quinolinate synthase, partial [Chloroflexi bacterium]